MKTLHINNLQNIYKIAISFNNIQHGFRPEKSVITATVSFIESVINSIDKPRNLPKAFIIVNHSFIIKKLQSLSL